MRILLLAPQPFFQERGTPIAVRMMAEDLRSAGHKVDLLVFHEGNRIDMEDIAIHRIPSLPGIAGIGPGFSLKKLFCDFFMLFKAVHLCRKYDYDVIHAVEESVYIAAFVKLIFKKPYIYDVDSWMSEQLIEKFPLLRSLSRPFVFCETRAVCFCDAAVVVCQALEEKVLAIDAECRVLRLEDVSLLEEVTGQYESLKKIVQNNDGIILYVGNLEKYQGIDLLLESYRQYTSCGGQASLVVIGGDEKGREKYLKRAEGLAIGSRVFFIGTRPLEHLGMYLQQADVLVSPRTEGDNTPMKIYSYMASGMPIVATRIKSHTQILSDETAFLTDADAKAMSARFHEAFADGKRAELVGKAARKKAEEKYSRAAYRKKIRDFYSELSHVWNLRN